MDRYTDFGWVADISRLKLDAGLMHVLVEKCCPLNHAYYLSIGEMTITLSDVQTILGLQVNGSPITDLDREALGDGVYALDLCHELLGVVPQRSEREKRGTDMQVS